MSDGDATVERVANLAMSDDMAPLDLPADFTFGVATSAFQIEGATAVDGRGPSIWDEFCRAPGAILDASDGSVACDSYRRWAQDLDLIADLGFAAYRFSVAWPRIVPDDSGRVNSLGLDHYERVVDGLLERGIAPFVTLYHWDLPLWLHARGGWTARDTSYAFAAYAEAVAGRLGDRVASYATLNEPWCSAFLGYGQGEHAPGVRDSGACQAAIHHLLLAHGLAVQRLRSATTSPLGIVLNFTPAYPLDANEPSDREAARRHRLSNDEVFLGPLFKGAYPRELRDLPGSAASHASPGDLSIIGEPLDFLGVNYYTRTVVRASPGAPWPSIEHVPPTGARTAMGWEVYPAGLRDLLLELDRAAGIPLYVTENGAAFDDHAGGAVLGDIKR
ncbi:MAG TPA: family 1 glycosylhydrolase, partial [Trueperaceae bacterium]|nr:family 1 glycosylhydrolase [Trueperaceae bacterium]